MMIKDKTKNKVLLLAALALLAIVVFSCESKKSTDGSKVPLDVKEAEAKDPTRLDSVRTDVAPKWGHDDAVTDSTK